MENTTANVPFTLKKEHITLMSHLCFGNVVGTACGDAIIPVIDEKRPFGNSGATHSVQELLGLPYDEEGERVAEQLLMELPVALEIVMTKHTFVPGVYFVDRYGAYYDYLCTRNYFSMKEPIKVLEEELPETDENGKVLEAIRRASFTGAEDPVQEMIEFISGTNVVAEDKIIEVLSRFKATPPEETGTFKELKRKCMLDLLSGRYEDADKAAQGLYAMADSLTAAQAYAVADILKKEAKVFLYDGEPSRAAGLYSQAEELRAIAAAKRAEGNGKETENGNG